MALRAVPSQACPPFSIGGGQEVVWPFHSAALETVFAAGQGLVSPRPGMEETATLSRGKPGFSRGCNHSRRSQRN